MRRVYFVGVALVALLAVGAGIIWSGRTASARAEAEKRATELSAGPVVRVTQAKLSPPIARVQLQGEARPFASVTLYAKVSGYLKQVRVDKGDRVKKDQVLAVIESPEVDRQYDAAMADATYKRAEAKRAASLAGPGVVSARQAELEESQAHVADANVAALGTQKAYETLRAPFAGTVTARFADPGALVQNAANAQTGALPVVTVSQIERLRVYVYVDQRLAAQVHMGDEAEIRTPAQLTRKGTVTRLSRELDPKTRTMLVEIDLDNSDGAIVPGSFVEVTLQVKSPPLVEVPVEALVMHGDQALVGVVKDGTLHLQPVVVTEDDGARVRVSSGLQAGEPVALNVGDTLADGARVRAKADAAHP